MYRVCSKIPPASTSCSRSATDADRRERARDHRDPDRQRTAAAPHRVDRRQSPQGGSALAAASWPTSTCPIPRRAAIPVSIVTTSRRSDKQGAVIDERFNSGGQVADYIIEAMQPQADGLVEPALRRHLPYAGGFHPGTEGDDHQRNGRLRRRRHAVDVPLYQDRSADRQAHLGRADRHLAIPGADGRRQRDGAQLRLLQSRGTVGRGEPRRGAGRRNRAWIPRAWPRVTIRNWSGRCSDGAGSCWRRIRRPTPKRPEFPNYQRPARPASAPTAGGGGR